MSAIITPFFINANVYLAFSTCMAIWKSFNINYMARGIFIFIAIVTMTAMGADVATQRGDTPA